MTRQEIIDGFHKLYLAKIAEETQKRGKLGARAGAGIPMKDLTRIHNEAIADYVVQVLKDYLPNWQEEYAAFP